MNTQITSEKLKKLFGLDISQKKIDDLFKDGEYLDEYSHKQKRAIVSENEVIRQNQELTNKSKTS